MTALSDEMEGITYHNNHNVFILGAGFSVDAGLPTMKTFIRDMRYAISWADSQNHSDIKQDLINTLKFIKTSSSAGYRCKIDLYNIEDVFSLFDAMPSGEVTQRKRFSMQKAIAATLEYRIAEYRAKPKTVLLHIPTHVDTSLDDNYLELLNDEEGPSRKKVIPIYEAITAILSSKFSVKDREPQPKNTVITFNYDTLIEESLERMSIPYNLGISNNSFPLSITSLYAASGNQYDNESSLQLLKLHGSIGWALSNDSSHMNIYQTAGQLFAASDQGYEQMVLEPPTWNKGKSAPILQSVWDSAITALSTATRIFVIGYSLPLTDSHFKYLMSASLMNNISLENIYFVNPSFNGDNDVSHMQERILTILREDLRMDGTVQLLPHKSTDFLLAPGVNGHLDKTFFPFISMPSLDISFFAYR
ncbi:hypothetical protein HFU84_10855 [Acidithiobacillus sp. CV18-2]|nr:hypothetical protein [Acidithiobacillus sp. CV18-3]MBU2756907.1 hypothetical protein [Acidithiobacillus sp. BN09-2]MBU2777995.1 hypothetical protein [Acidithiobacillus sp. CV18-2]MBU2799618.1 hypothetical protein [Acidithiobacillus sp. VAN18-4]